MEAVAVLLVLFAALAALLFRTHLTRSRGKGSTPPHAPDAGADADRLWWPRVEPPIPRAGSLMTFANCNPSFHC